MLIVNSNEAGREGVLPMEVLSVVSGAQEAVKESQVVEAGLRTHMYVRMGEVQQSDQKTQLFNLITVETHYTRVMQITQILYTNIEPAQR